MANNFRTAFRRQLQQIPGYAGGNLQDQLDDEQWHPPMAAPAGAQPNPPLPAPREMPAPGPQAPAIEPTEPAGRPAVDVGELGQTPKVPVVYDPVTGRPDRKTIQALNPEGGLGEYYGDLQKWEPRGGKRGFKQAMKTGLMYASEAIKNNPDHPLEAAIAGFGTGAIGGTAAPNFKNRLRRQWELSKTGQELQSQLGLQKEQAQIESLGMVPVQVPDGRGGYVTTQVPKGKVAGVLAGAERNRIGGERLGETKRVNDARMKRWDGMSADQRRRAIIAEYNAGMLNDPESLEYAATELKIPGELKEKFIQGQLRDAIDANGNLIEVNKQTRTAAPVLNAQGQPQGSFAATQEQGRNTRAAASEAGKTARGGARGRDFTSPQMQKRVDDAASLHSIVERNRDIAQQAQEAINNGKTNITIGGTDYNARDAQKTALRNAKDAAYKLNAGYSDLYDAGPGEGGWAWSQPKSQGASQAPQVTVQPAERGKFDKDKYIKAYQRAHKGKQPSQADIEHAETLWTNP